MKVLVSFLLLTSAGGDTDLPKASGEPAVDFVQANRAYAKGDYESAVTLYHELVERGAISGHVYFNLGNSYLRLGHLGKAIAAYRKSEALLPRNQDVQANLEFARKSTKDAVSPTKPPAVARTLLFWHFSLSRDELTLGFLTMNALVWLLMTLRLYHQESEILRWTLGITILMTLPLGASAALRHASPQIVAVVQSPEVAVFSGKDENSVIRFRLHEGTEAEVVATSDTWVRIALADGKQGWLPARHLDIVSM